MVKVNVLGKNSIELAEDAKKGEIIKLDELVNTEISLCDIDSLDSILEKASILEKQYKHILCLIREFEWIESDIYEYEYLKKQAIIEKLIDLENDDNYSWLHCNLFYHMVDNFSSDYISRHEIFTFMMFVYRRLMSAYKKQVINKLLLLEENLNDKSCLN